MVKVIPQTPRILEECQNCHLDSRVSWHVRDEIWLKVVPESLRNKVVCLECFLEFCDEYQPSLALGPADFLFFGFSGVSNFFGIIIQSYAAET